MLHEFEDYRFNRAKKRKATEFPSSEREREKQTLLPFRKVDVIRPIINQQQFDKKIVSFVVDGMYPLSIVENEKFRDLFSGNLKLYLFILFIDADCRHFPAL